jgi:hypothetical protein
MLLSSLSIIVSIYHRYHRYHLMKPTPVTMMSLGFLCRFLCLRFLCLRQAFRHRRKCFIMLQIGPEQWICGRYWRPLALLTTATTACIGSMPNQGPFNDASCMARSALAGLCAARLAITVVSADTLQSLASLCRIGVVRIFPQGLFSSCKARVWYINCCLLPRPPLGGSPDWRARPRPHRRHQIHVVGTVKLVDTLSRPACTFVVVQAECLRAVVPPTLDSVVDAGIDSRSIDPSPGRREEPALLLLFAAAEASVELLFWSVLLVLVPFLLIARAGFLVVTIYIYIISNFVVSVAVADAVGDGSGGRGDTYDCDDRNRCGC